MRAWDAVRQKKWCASTDAWKSGKMPREAFPLSKNRSFVLGTGWRWCVSRLEASSSHYRLLIAFHQGKGKYLAWLGLEDGADQAVVARLEYHPDHRQWHCHVKNGALSEVSRGVVKEAGRRERCWLCRSEREAAVSELDDISIAFRAFGVESTQANMEPFL